MALHPHIQTAMQVLGCNQQSAELVIEDVGTLINWSEDSSEEIKLWLLAGQRTLIDHPVCA